MALESARADLGKILDKEIEERGDSFDSDVDTAKNKVRAMQSELEAAALLEPDEHEHRSETVTSEDLELRGLIGNANAGRIIEAAIRGHATEGAERELQQHYGLSSMSLPLSLLETRAVATVTGDEPNESRPVLGQLFPSSVAAFAGVAIETVAVGEAGYPVISTGATPEELAKSAAGTESTAAIVITTLTPKRLQASLRYQREQAQVLPYLDDSLRENLSMALASQLDKQILNRATEGLLTFGTAPTKNGGSVSNFSHALDAIYSSIDGSYASMASEIRMLLGTATFSDLGKALLTASAVPAILSLEKLSQLCGGVRTSGHMPVADATNGDEALVIIGPPRRNAVAAVWPGVDLVVDPYTSANKGEIVVTALMMQDSAVLREAGYKRLRFK